MSLYNEKRHPLQKACEKHKSRIQSTITSRRNFMFSTATSMRYSKLSATARHKFYEGLQSLPNEFEEIIRDSYQERIERGHNKPLLGEIAPWILTDLMPISSHDNATAILAPWMNLYAYTLFMDDLLDQPHNGRSPELLLASGLLLEKGITALCRMFPSSAHLHLNIDCRFTEAAYAALKEIKKHRNRIQEFPEADIAGIGEKVALLKLCASCLIYANNSDSSDATKEDNVIISIGSLATGMQLLDDVTDWEEDWTSTNYSYLLTSTFTKIQEMGIKRPLPYGSANSDEVFIAMILTGSLEDIIDRAAYNLSQVVSAPYSDSDTEGKRLLKAIRHEYNLFAIEIADCRKLMLQFQLERQRNIGSKSDKLKYSFEMKSHSREKYSRRDILDDLSSEPKINLQLDYLAKRLQIVAQNS
jgi:hypothetical protein